MLLLSALSLYYREVVEEPAGRTIGTIVSLNMHTCHYQELYETRTQADIRDHVRIIMRMQCHSQYLPLAG